MSGGLVKNPANEVVPLNVNTAGGLKVVPQNASAVAVTIANTASLSNALDLGEARAGALVLPAAFAWTAAGLSALVSHDGITFVQLYDETDTLWSIATTNLVAGRARALPLTLFLPFRFLKFQSGTQAAPVAQLSDRVMQLVVN